MKENKNKFIELHNAGKSYTKIGKLFNISRQRVHQIIMDYHLKYKSKITKSIKITKDDIRYYFDYRCQICGRLQKELQYTLHIHHIDGHHKNNTIDNIIVLCGQ